MSESVTVAMLIYRSVPWLRFAIEGLEAAKNETPWKLLVVGNDAEPEVRDSGLVDIDHRNPDPSEYYINRVYRAWNRAVAEAHTDRVVLMNSDMYVSDRWLDELVAAPPMTLPCSLLVESGRLASGMPEYVRDFGKMPERFDRVAWREHAATLSAKGVGRTEPGRLFMPVLVNRDEFLAVGGYPEGNVGGMSGDDYFFRRMGGLGYRHITCLGSVVYHAQEGEMRNTE